MWQHFVATLCLSCFNGHEHDVILLVDFSVVHRAKPQLLVVSVSPCLGLFHAIRVLSVDVVDFDNVSSL